MGTSLCREITMGGVVVRTVVGSADVVVDVVLVVVVGRVVNAVVVAGRGVDVFWGVWKLRAQTVKNLPRLFCLCTVRLYSIKTKMIRMYVCLQNS